MTYKTVLFDWEGVLGPQDTRAFGWLMRRLEDEYPVEYEAAVEALVASVGDFLIGAIDNRAFWARVGERLGVEFGEEFQDTIWQEWHGAVPLPEMRQLVQTVKDKGLRVVVFSNILPTSAAEIRRNGGYDNFDALVLSYEAGFKKPDPRIYQKALQVAQCQAEECIFIDDREDFLAPARKCGMRTILAHDSTQIQDELLKLLR